MPDSESCEHLERLAAAGARRREAEDARQRSVEELHREVASARAAPGCSHSHRAIATAAGLSLGGVHNALLTVGPSDAVASPPATYAPSPIPKALLEVTPEPRSSEHETPATDAPSPVPETRREVEPRSSEHETPATDAPSPVPEARQPAGPAVSTSKLPSGTTVRKVNAYARRPPGQPAGGGGRAARPAAGAGSKSAKPARPAPQAKPQPRAAGDTIEARRSAPRRKSESSYPDLYPATVARRPPAKHQQESQAEARRSREVYPGIY